MLCIIGGRSRPRPRRYLLRFLPHLDRTLCYARHMCKLNLIRRHFGNTRLYSPQNVPPRLDLPKRVNLRIMTTPRKLDGVLPNSEVMWTLPPDPSPLFRICETAARRFKVWRARLRWPLNRIPLTFGVPCRHLRPNLNVQAHNVPLSRMVRPRGQCRSKQLFS